MIYIHNIYIYIQYIHVHTHIYIYVYRIIPVYTSPYLMGFIPYLGGTRITPPIRWIAIRPSISSAVLRPLGVGCPGTHSEMYCDSPLGQPGGELR